MIDRFSFRVWNTTTKKMHLVWGFTPFNIVLNSIATDNITLKRSECVLMQCTGLKDKNDKLIYEGDIVKFKTIQNLWAKGKVVFTESCALFEIRYGIDFNNWELMDKYQYKVIGNIYENPELLEQTD